MQIFRHVLLSFYVPLNSPCNLICISFFSFALNWFSPAITRHPLAPFFAFSFILFLRPRCSGDKLDQQDTETALSKTDQPHNCSETETQAVSDPVKREWDIRSAAGAENTDRKRGQV